MIGVSIIRRADLSSNEYTPYFRVSGTIVAYDGGEDRH